ncbi:MAG: galactokinase [Bacteroidales bacterium]
MIQDTIHEKFVERYGEHPQLFSAPGRINVIGEHTDYNDGFVLPAAINKRIYFALKKNDSGQCRIYAHDIDEEYTFPADQKEPVKKTWVNYPLGVIREMMKIREFNLTGFDCVFGGDLPLGAGLSSSAALETGFAHAINEIFDVGVEPAQIMHLSQNAEHNFAGMPCGIMDQFAAVYGKKGHVVKLDCRSMDSDYYPLHFKDYQLILCNSNVQHELASSEYNVRRKQCDEGVGIIKQNHPSVKNLRDVTFDMLEEHQDQMDEVVLDRCLYVLRENERVHDTCEKLQENDVDAIGRNLYLSHKGLSEMYEVSCDETDFLVDLTKDMEYVKGARMMGGGFGGSTINLVKIDSREEFEERLAKAYYDRFSIQPDFFEVETDDGIKSH